MDKQDLVFLTDLYNILRTITTSDRNTILMGKCLEALGDFLVTKQQEIKEQEIKEE